MNKQDKEMKIEEMEAISGGPHYTDFSGSKFSSRNSLGLHNNGAFRGSAPTDPNGVVLRLGPGATFED
jgi:hypothetical protein